MGASSSSREEQRLQSEGMWKGCGRAWPCQPGKARIPALEGRQRGACVPPGCEPSRHARLTPTPRYEAGSGETALDTEQVSTLNVKTCSCADFLWIYFIFHLCVSVIPLCMYTVCAWFPWRPEESTESAGINHGPRRLWGGGVPVSRPGPFASSATLLATELPSSPSHWPFLLKVDC